MVWKKINTIHLNNLMLFIKGYLMKLDFSAIR